MVRQVLLSCNANGVTNHLGRGYAMALLLNVTYYMARLTVQGMVDGYVLSHNIDKKFKMVIKMTEAAMTGFFEVDWCQ